MARATNVFNVLEQITRLGVPCRRAKCHLPENNIRKITPEENYILLWFHDNKVFYELYDMKEYYEKKQVAHVNPHQYCECSVSIAMALIYFNLMDKKVRDTYLVASGSADNKFSTSYIRSLLTPEDKSEINKMIDRYKDEIAAADVSKRTELENAMVMLLDIMSETPKK
jgi:hypothetical protein